MLQMWEKPKLGDKHWEWTTKQNKEVGEVLEVSGGRRFVVAEKEIKGRESGYKAPHDQRRLYEVGAYKLVEEGTGEVLVIGFEYEVEENGK